MRRKVWVCVTTLYYNDFLNYYFAPMDSKYLKFLFTKQIVLLFQKDSSSHFKIQFYNMSIKVLAENNHLLPQ